MANLNPSLLRSAGLALLISALLVSAVHASPAGTCDSAGAPGGTCHAAAADGADGGPDLHVEDGWLSEELRNQLIQHLDAHEPTNPLGVVMAPVPQSLAQRFRGALAALGAGSARAGRFAQLSLSAFARGAGAMPGKAVGSVAKGCHSDFEVDEGFNVENVLGPTEGRVGILYLSGEGEFVLIDEATGEETRQEVKPGRFMSWKNTGNRHCLATNSAQKRRFIGPVVLDASKSGFIPVVDILAGPATPCNATTQCPVSMPTCKEGLCCAAAGSPAVRETFCCPGAMFWSPGNKCCYAVGAAASQASQCCTGRMINNVCAPIGDVSCLPKCKRDAHNAYLAHVRTCGRKPNSSRRKTCEESVAASMHEHLAWCHSNVLPTRCW